jgi:hypothetical protein
LATRPTRSAVFWVAAVALLVLFAGLYACPIWDIDFWWHAATGRWIVENREIPAVDPFDVYRVYGTRADVILKSYWLAQVALYEVFAHLGTAGVSALTATLLAGALAVGVLRAERLGANRLATLVALGAAGAATARFTGARPQLFSFFFASALFLPLDRGDGRTSNLALGVPAAIMLLWANTHGAVTLGAALLCVYAAGALVEARALGVVDAMRPKTVWAIGAAALASLVSPLGVETYTYLLQWHGSVLESRTSEWSSPVALWQAGDRLPAYWVLLALAAVATLGLLRTRRVKEAFVTGALAALSLTAVRHGPLLAFAAAPYVALGLTPLLDSPRVPSRALTVGAAILALALTVRGLVLGTTFRHGIEPGRFPVAGATLLEERHASGRIFNHLNWGGYLLFRLSPGIHPFIDGRVLDERTLAFYTNVLWWTDDGRRAFAAERFDYVLIAGQNPLTGEAYPLPARLLEDPSWRLLDRREDAWLFERVHGPR